MSLIENTKASRCFTIGHWLSDIPKYFLQHLGPVLFSYVTKMLYLYSFTFTKRLLIAVNHKGIL